jgi:hypothetical protein
MIPPSTSGGNVPSFVSLNSTVLLTAKFSTKFSTTTRCVLSRVVLNLVQVLNLVLNFVLLLGLPVLNLVHSMTQLVTWQPLLVEIPKL